MSTPPQETDTRTVDLTTDQRWVVHHTLVTRADAYIDANEPVPSWLLELLERIEADDETLTVQQGRNLEGLLEERVPTLPEPDQEAAAATLSTLETALA